MARVSDHVKEPVSLCSALLVLCSFTIEVEKSESEEWVAEAVDCVAVVAVVGLAVVVVGVAVVVVGVAVVVVGVAVVVGCADDVEDVVTSS